MRSVRFIPALGVLALLAACANDPTVHEIADPTPPAPATGAEFAWSAAAGANSIEAATIVRSQRGNVRTCAGLTATLLPRTPYDETLIALAFANDTQDFSPGGAADRKLGGAPATVSGFWRRAACDADGKAVFSHLPDGDYYLVATVTWDAPPFLGGTVMSQIQGGVLMQRIHVGGAETKQVTLTAVSSTDTIFN
jgi:hypothetical protein